MPPYDLSNIMVVGISSRALFDLEKENEIFDTQGLEAYTTYQIEKIDDIPKPGTGFRLVKNILSLNEEGKERKVEVIVLSKNNPARRKLGSGFQVDKMKQGDNISTWHVNHAYIILEDSIT